MREIRLLSRPGCHLCEGLRRVAEPVVLEAGFTLIEVNVDGDDALREQWGNEIPVLLDDGGRLLAKVRDDAGKIRRRLRALS